MLKVFLPVVKIGLIVLEVLESFLPTNLYFAMMFRLAYHQRVKDIVPESFIALVPEKPEPIFKYENEDAAKTEESMEQESK